LFCLVPPTATARKECTGFPNQEFVIGTKEAPPFAMKAADGTWTGISIDLWQQIADLLGVSYTLAEEATLEDLISHAQKQTLFKYLGEKR
jgi:ABC-type amino acid transport substrate-binding protein